MIKLVCQLFYNKKNSEEKFILKFMFCLELLLWLCNLVLFCKKRMDYSTIFKNNPNDLRVNKTIVKFKKTNVFKNYLSTVVKELK